MAIYTSFFNRARRHMSVVGITFNHILHHAVPIRECPRCSRLWENGKCPECDNTAGWRQTNCNKCGSKNAFVFQSKADPYVFFIFCQRCNKWEAVQGLPAKLKKANYNEVNPPLSGSKTRPNV